MATQAERVAIIEEKVKGVDRNLKIAGGAAAAWLAFLTLKLFTLSSAIAHVQGKVGDSLSVSIRTIEHPSDSAQLRAALITVAAQAATAQYEKRKPNVEVLKKTSGVVAEATKKPGTPVEAWQAAAQLVSYRSSVDNNFNTDQPRNCLDTYSSYTPHPSNFNSRVSDMSVANCQLDLSDLVGFWNSEFGKHIKAEIDAGQTDRLNLFLQNVVVVYSGGPTIPFSQLACDGCTFRFNVNSVPPKAGSTLIRGLLQADLKLVTIQIPDAARPT